MGQNGRGLSGQKLLTLTCPIKRIDQYPNHLLNIFVIYLEKSKQNRVKKRASELELQLKIKREEIKVSKENMINPDMLSTLLLSSDILFTLLTDKLDKLPNHPS